MQCYAINEDNSQILETLFVLHMITRVLLLLLITCTRWKFNCGEWEFRRVNLSTDRRLLFLTYIKTYGHTHSVTIAV